MLQSLLDLGLFATTGLTVHQLTVATVSWVAIYGPTDRRRRTALRVLMVLKGGDSR